MKPSIDMLLEKDLKINTSFNLNQVLIAMELGSTDKVMLKYLDLLFTQVPIKSAHFIHVLPKFDLFSSMYKKDSQALISNIEVNGEIIKQMKANIERLMAGKKTVRKEVDVKEGNPLEELLKTATSHYADLVVIGQNSAATQHGILAKNLVRKINCNALVVPDKAKNQLKKILVPVDFSKKSAKALQTAIALSDRLKAPVEITCLNVYEMPDASLYRIQKNREQFKRMLEEDRLGAFQEFITTYAADHKQNIRTKLLEKDMPGIAPYLLDFANTSDIDLIVIGAKGHSKVERLVLGSVTEKLMGINENIPTLIVK